MRSLLVVLVSLLMIRPVGSSRIVRAEDLGSADLNRVFATWDEWGSAYGDLVAALEGFERLTEKPVETAAGLVAVMEARDRVYQTARRVEDYIYLRLQLNGLDEEARSRQRLLDETDRRWTTRGSPWFRRTVTELGRPTVHAWLLDNDSLQRYEFFFRRFFDAAGHDLAEGQEGLGALSRVSARQSERVYNALAVAEAPTIEVTLDSGERLDLTPARARTVLWELLEATDRARVSRAWLERLGTQSRTYAALLEGIVERVNLMAKARGFDSALSATLRADAIPADAVRSAIRAARENSTPLRRYHEARKRAMGLDEYGLADRFVPLDPGGREIGLEEARSQIIESMSVLGSEVQEIVRRAFDEGWIDSVERPGKRAHGGATSVAGQPFVLVSYRGSLDSLFQLAHEIGHAVFSYIAYRSQPFVYSHPSSLTSEAVASVFEGALVEWWVERAADRREKIRLLDHSIQNLLRLFYRPMLDADFEIRLYETDIAITGPSLDALYLEVVQEFYGETVSRDDWDGHAWQQVPQFYTSPLYMGRYGLSAAAANALIQQLTSSVESERTAARRAFLELMRSGSSDYPIRLLSVAGANLRDPRTVEAVVARLVSLVNELERAVDSD